MEKALEIGNLQQSHYEQVIALWQLCGLPLKPQGRDSRSEYSRQLELEQLRFIGLFDGKRVTGTVLATHDGRKGWINRLAVHPDYSGRGYGARLISEAERWLESQGIRIFACLIEPGYEVSRAVFEKAGYSLFEGVAYHTKRLAEDV